MSEQLTETASPQADAQAQGSHANGSADAPNSAGATTAATTTAATTAAEPTAANTAPAESSSSDESSGDTPPRAAAPSATAPSAESAGADSLSAESEESQPSETANVDVPASGEDQQTPPPETQKGQAQPESVQADAAGKEGAPKKRKRKRKRKKKGGTAAEAGGEGVDRGRHSVKPATDRAPFHVGEEVFGRVTAVLEHAIMIDLSGKALGVFDRGEMEADDLVPEVGDRFVARVHQDGSRGGLVVLTRKPLREETSKPAVEAAAKDGTLIFGLVTGVIKGGVDVDIDGVRAFAPASGMDLHPHNANFNALVGQRLQFKVTQYEKAGRDVVVTRRPMLEAEAHERRKKALELLKEEQVMPGVVRTVVDWGVFVALPEAENLEGLIHVSEATHDPRAKLAELFKSGDKFDVQITKIDDKGKIWLSRKALIADPWADAKKKYGPGTALKAKVTRLERFGAFIDLEDIEGLIYTSDLSPTRRVGHPEEVLKVGEEVDVIVHNLDLKNKKVTLHPKLPEEYAEEKPQKVQRNAGVEVEVLKSEPAGLSVRVLGVTGRNARGFIPAGQTGTARGTDLRKAFKIGSRLRVKVIDLDPRRGEPKLSIRQLADDEERQAHRDYRAKVAKEAKFGTLGDLLAKLK